MGRQLMSRGCENRNEDGRMKKGERKSPGHAIVARAFCFLVESIVKTCRLSSLLLLTCFVHVSAPAQSPFDTTSVRKSDLVEIVLLDSTIKTDIRYATE